MKSIIPASLLIALLGGCTGEIAGTDAPRPGDPGAPGAPNSPTGSGAGSTGSPTPGAGTANGGPTGGPSGGGAPNVIGGGAAAGGTVSTVPATDPGRVTLHRLNRAEYNNTVRDLLGTTLRPGDEFPIDDRGNGFDNMADVLSLSPLHMSNYQAAAAALVTEALANATQRARVVPCNLAQQGATCARTVLASFLPRAYRRPVTDAEVDVLMKLVTTATAQGDPVEQGLKLALQASLMSPNFLFRVELDPEPSSLSAHALSSYERASRLSYFLWSSMPDDELFAAAAANTLSDSAAVVSQAVRMLASPKAAALVDNFAGQWLFIRSIDEVSPDPVAFPNLDASLRAAEKAETALLFQEIALNGLPADQLLTADFTFINDRLARHYGLPAVGSTSPVRVSLAGNTQRRGFLSHAGVLTVTSHPTRTSPVLRGKWILNQLLCTDVPPPPVDVQTMLTEGSVVNGATIRERLEQHRADPACATCHKIMDPIGFGLENYDAIGAYRTTDAGSPVDSAGVLPDGRTFSGPVELATIVAKDPNFPRCMAEKLYSYALGRAPDRTANHMDGPTLAKLSETLTSSGFSFRELVTQLVQSAPYLNRRGEP